MFSGVLRLFGRVGSYDKTITPPQVQAAFGYVGLTFSQTLVLADTAGRLHNKENLVRELQKIDRIAKTKASEGCYKKILVLDATTGQNGLRQAEVFHEAIGVDAVFLTKYDSTAKGGVAVTVGKELNLPMAFVGTGEKYENISPFSAESYVKEFIGKI